MPLIGTTDDTLTQCSVCERNLTAAQLWRGDSLEPLCHCCAITRYPTICRVCRGHGVRSRAETGAAGPMVCEACAGEG